MRTTFIPLTCSSRNQITNHTKMLNLTWAQLVCREITFHFATPSQCSLFRRFFDPSVCVCVYFQFVRFAVHVSAIFDCPFQWAKASETRNNNNNFTRADRQVNKPTNRANWFNVTVLLRCSSVCCFFLFFALCRSFHDHLPLKMLK